MEGEFVCKKNISCNSGTVYGMVKCRSFLCTCHWERFRLWFHSIDEGCYPWKCNINNIVQLLKNIVTDILPHVHFVIFAMLNIDRPSWSTMCGSHQFSQISTSKTKFSMIQSPSRQPKKSSIFFFRNTKILFALKAFQHTTKFWFDQHWITVFSHTNNQTMIMNPNNHPANLQGSVPVSNNSPTLVWSCHQKTMWFSFGLGTFWGMFTSFYCELTVSSCFGN